MREGIPQGWRRAAISEVAQVFLGKTPAKTDYTSSGNLKVVKFRDLRNGCIDFHNSKDGFVRGNGDVIAGLRELRRADVLITSAAHSGENIGKKCAYVSGLPAEFERVFFTGELLGIRCEDETLSRWIYLFFRSAEGFTEIQKAVTGVHLTGGRAKQMTVPLAPLSEQRHIVAKLEKLLARVDTCRQRLATIPTLLKRFRQSVLATACSGRLTADWREEHPEVEPVQRVGKGEPPEDFQPPSSWNWWLSEHVLDFVTSGSRGWAKYYSNTGALFIRVGNLDHDSIKLDLQSVQRVRPPQNAEGRRTRVQRGDILISITADVGMIALVDQDIGEAYINQHVALARPTGNMDNRYLAFFFSAKNGGQKQLQNLQRGATKIGLGLDDIRNVWIACPPPAEQQEIIRRVETLFALVDQIEARCARAKVHAGNLTQSILAKAFRGELVAP